MVSLTASGDLTSAVLRIEGNAKLLKTAFNPQPDGSFRLRGVVTGCILSLPTVVLDVDGVAVPFVWN